jgi:Sensors of blue-light using FAD
MYEITYYSSAKPGLKATDISAILETAHVFNEINGITGCLVYYKNQFIQVLEGKKEVVEDLLSRIKNDSRHAHLFVLAEAEKAERTFLLGKGSTAPYGQLYELGRITYPKQHLSFRLHQKIP